MKKSIVTYILFVCCACFSLGVIACPVKKAVKTNTSANQAGQQSYHFQKISWLAKDAGRESSNEDRFSGFSRTFSSCSVFHSFTLPDPFVAATSSPIAETQINIAESEQVLKDHLLHLFPSHYFW